MKLAVIAPTFNESENVVPFVNMVRKALGSLDYEVLIVDDDSPDLTWQRVHEIARRDPRVGVIRRMSERGLASSVIDGFMHTEAEFIACIDADLQHDPAILPTMLKLLEENNALVIGSRYVPNGKVQDWSHIRQFESQIATKLAKICLGIEVSDPMSGFFMMRREDFLRIREKLNVRGFKILLEILVALRPQKVVETPYTFRGRLAGESKLSAGIAGAYLLQLLRLGAQRSGVSIRFLKFGVVGAIGVAVNLLAMSSIVYFSRYAGWQASVMASTVATISNYCLNNAWTFRDRSHAGAKFITGYFSYLGMSLIGIAAAGLSYSFFRFLSVRIASPAVAVAPTAVILTCQLLSIVVGIYLNFTLNRTFTWREPLRTLETVAPLNFVMSTKKPGLSLTIRQDPEITLRRRQG